MGESGGVESILNREEIAIIGGVAETEALTARYDISLIDSRFHIYLHPQSPTTNLAYHTGQYLFSTSTSTITIEFSALDSNAKQKSSLQMLLPIIHQNLHLTNQVISPGLTSPSLPHPFHHLPILPGNPDNAATLPTTPPSLSRGFRATQSPAGPTLIPLLYMPL